MHLFLWYNGTSLLTYPQKVLAHSNVLARNQVKFLFKYCQLQLHTNYDERPAM